MYISRIRAWFFKLLWNISVEINVDYFIMYWFYIVQCVHIDFILCSVHTYSWLSISRNLSAWPLKYFHIPIVLHIFGHKNLLFGLIQLKLQLIRSQNTYTYIGESPVVRENFYSSKVLSQLSLRQQQVTVYDIALCVHFYRIVYTHLWYYMLCTHRFYILLCRWTHKLYCVVCTQILYWFFCVHIHNFVLCVHIHNSVLCVHTYIHCCRHSLIYHWFDN